MFGPTLLICDQSFGSRGATNFIEFGAAAPKLKAGSY